MTPDEARSIQAAFDKIAAEAQASRYVLGALVAFLGLSGDMNAEGFIAFLKARTESDVFCGSAESRQMIAMIADGLLSGPGRLPFTVIQGGRAEPPVGD